MKWKDEIGFGRTDSTPNYTIPLPDMLIGFQPCLFKPQGTENTEAHFHGFEPLAFSRSRASAADLRATSAPRYGTTMNGEIIPQKNS